MCGLVGLINKSAIGFSREQQEVFSTLLFVDQLRGPDSTGVFALNYDGDVMVAKDALNSTDFLQTKEYQAAMQKVWNRGSAIIGHNRKATRGSVNDENAHPFNVDNNIILVHNGTMTDDHKKHAQVEVDSHAIAHLIHEKGNVTEALSAFNGAYALIWYDVRDCSINFIRNDQRPLWWMETANSWIWSSEKAMLDFVTARHNLKLIEEPAELPEDIHQKFTLSNRSWVASNEKLTITPPKSPWVSNYGGGYSFNGRNHQNNYHDPYDFEGGEWNDRIRPQQQQQHNKVIQMLPPPANNTRPTATMMEPPEFSGRQERERALARKENKIVTYGEFQERVVKAQQYAYDTKVMVCPFDYDYVNGKDSTDGFYLYASPLDDDSVIFRQWFSPGSITEERMVQIASTGYVYSYVCGVKGWTVMSGQANASRSLTDVVPGFLIVRSRGCELIHRGEDRINVNSKVH